MHYISPRHSRSRRVDEGSFSEDNPCYTEVMLIRKAYRYRLYPTRSQDDKLDRVLSRCRDLYNAALYQRREAYRVSKIGVSYCMQQNELPAVAIPVSPRVFPIPVGTSS
jgi:Helix-turn-helix domain